MMNKPQITRYDRQTILREIGEPGQNILRSSSVLVIGSGGLGCPVLLYLAGAGIGRINIIDGDLVSLTNLNRQLLYCDNDLGKPKALAAASAISKINPEISVSGDNVYLAGNNSQDLLSGYDIIIPCLDSLDTRRIVNRTAVENNTPFVEGAVSAFHGSITTILPGITPCYECIYQHSTQPEPPIPVIGAMAGIIGSAMALAAIKLLLDIPDPSRGALVFFDGYNWGNNIIPIKRNMDCPICSNVLIN